MKKIIITAGPTCEQIDRIRFITNISSGRTASAIGNYLSKKNLITYIHSKNVKYLPEKSKNIKFIKFGDFKSLNEILKEKLSRNKYDCVIHLAAVSDYSINKIIINGKKYFPPLKRKISSEHKKITLDLKKNFKIIDRLREYSKNKKIFTIGFKLTSNAKKDLIIKAVRKIKTDMVIHNDTSQITEKKHIFKVFRNNKMMEKLKNEKELSIYLKNLMEEI